MPQYRVTLKTEIRVDGWTNYRDREYKTITKRVVVEAPNKGAVTAVVMRNKPIFSGYDFSGRHTQLHFSKYDIVKIVRLPKKKQLKRSPSLEALICHFVVMDYVGGEYGESWFECRHCGHTAECTPKTGEYV